MPRRRELSGSSEACIDIYWVKANAGECKCNLRLSSDG